MKNIKTYTEVLTESEGKEIQNVMLVQAAEENDLQKAIDALDAGADVNTRSSIYGPSIYSSRTPLHTAASIGFADMCRLLMERGARVNEVDDNRSTPLHMAAGNGFTEVVDILLDAGADIDPVNNAGQTPLIRAGKTNRSMRTIRKLIERGADPFKAFKNPQEILNFFNDDIDWMPDELKAKLKRMQRGKQAFGM